MKRGKDYNLNPSSYSSLSESYRPVIHIERFGALPRSSLKRKELGKQFIIMLNACTYMCPFVFIFLIFFFFVLCMEADAFLIIVYIFMCIERRN